MERPSTGRVAHYGRPAVHTVASDEPDDTTPAGSFDADARPAALARSIELHTELGLPADAEPETVWAARRERAENALRAEPGKPMPVDPEVVEAIVAARDHVTGRRSAGQPLWDPLPPEAAAEPVPTPADPVREAATERLRVRRELGLRPWATDAEVAAARRAAA